MWVVGVCIQNLADLELQRSIVWENLLCGLLEYVYETLQRSDVWENLLCGLMGLCICIQIPKHAWHTLDEVQPKYHIKTINSLSTHSEIVGYGRNRCCMCIWLGLMLCLKM